MKVLKGVEFLKCFPKNALNQFAGQEGAVMDLILGKETGLAVKVSVHFGNSDYSSVTFKIVMERDKCSLETEVLYWGRVISK